MVDDKEGEQTTHVYSTGPAAIAAKLAAEPTPAPPDLGPVRDSVRRLNDIVQQMQTELSRLQERIS